MSKRKWTVRLMYFLFSPFTLIPHWPWLCLFCPVVTYCHGQLRVLKPLMVVEATASHTRKLEDIKSREAVFDFPVLILVYLNSTVETLKRLGVQKLGVESRDSLVFLDAIWPWYISLLLLSPSLLGKCCSRVLLCGGPWWKFPWGQIIWLLTVRFTVNMASNIIASHLLQPSALHRIALRAKIEWISDAAVSFPSTVDLQCI